MRYLFPSLGWFSAFFLFAAPAQAVLIEFSAAEGLSIRNLAADPPGTGSTNFSLDGANFSGGEVASAGIGNLYASPPASYVFFAPGMITFDLPVSDISFFFVDTDNAMSFSATAFDGANNFLATVFSNDPTFLGDPGNFVSFAGFADVARIEFEGGLIDNVSFAVSEPALLLLFASGLLGLGAVRRRHR